MAENITERRRESCKPYFMEHSTNTLSIATAVVNQLNIGKNGI